MTPAQILAALQLAESLFSTASTAYSDIKADLDAETTAQLNAAVAASGAALDAARTQLDADAA
jgi:hypothetical protein